MESITVTITSLYSNVSGHTDFELNESKNDLLLQFRGGGAKNKCTGMRVFLFTLTLELPI